MITHGDHSSFIMPIQIEKVPIVVPRKHEFDEHVNYHQVDFWRKVAERQGNIIVVEDVEKLRDTLNYYDDIVGKMANYPSSINECF